MNTTKEKTVGLFSDELASKAATPGGGGGSAVVGNLACALGQMVCNLTIGKAKYAEVEPEVIDICNKLEEERQALIVLVDEDAAAFGPLAKAYGIPKDDPTRAEVMEAATKGAMEPPMKIMESCVRVIPLLERLSQIGSKLALSDVGVAATCAKAALEGASLNIYINTAGLADKEMAASYNDRCDEMLATYGEMAAKTFEFVREEVR